jgi:DNA-binding LacI/PurR family transcriptional regulator
MQTIAGTIALSDHTTIIDIAKRVGLSASTVSRALNDHPDIKEETKNLVRRTAQELHYTPNPMAQSLKNRRTMTIGVIAPEIKHDFFSSAISGIEEVAHQHGYTIIVCQSNESVEREIANVDVLIHYRVAGVIVSISQETKCGEHFQELLRKKIPLVFFDRVCDDVQASKVVIDDERSAFDAVTYLLRKGYTKIAHFAGPQDLRICSKRMQGYADALQQHGIPMAEEFVRHGGLDEQDGYRSMDALIRDGGMPEAIFAVNDPVAIGAYQRIKEAGLRIPDDIAILGFSNSTIASLVDPPLTSIEQPSFDMGSRSAEILLDTIDGRMIVPRTLVLETKLVVRKSA